jgi:hypothetical protein
MSSEQGINRQLTLLAVLFVASGLSIWAVSLRPSRASAQTALTTDAMQTVPSMNRSRASASATTLTTGKVLITGGLDANYRYLADAELYDPSTKIFTMAPAMAAARAAHTATLLANGQVLVAGGVACANGRCSQLATAEIFDPDLLRFLPAGSMNTARANHTATLLDNGTVLITGGSNPDALSSAEIFDPISRRFTTTAFMTTPRMLHTATLLGGGEVLVTGGRGCVGGCDDKSASLTAEVYDPARRQFFYAGKLIHPRIRHSATLLVDGRVLISGGRSCVADCEGDKTLQETEIYDPGTGKFAAAGAMSTARAAHQAIALPDGEVFVYGGARRDGRTGSNYLNSGELFQPSTNAFLVTPGGTVAGDDLIAALLPNAQVLVAGGLVRGSIFRSANVFSFAPN